MLPTDGAQTKEGYGKVRKQGTLSNLPTALSKNSGSR